MCGQQVSAIGSCQSDHRSRSRSSPSTRTRFREIVHQRAPELELPQQSIEFEHEVWIDIIYKGQRIGRHQVDFVVGDAAGGVMLELKAEALLDDVDFIQTLSYLKS
ncbi:MAG: GxxExxY protein [Anaerolineae bacterium]|nr:GxxExxY protein [Anaerolineae bacterium]